MVLKKKGESSWSILIYMKIRFNVNCGGDQIICEAILAIKFHVNNHDEACYVTVKFIPF